jgi:MFS transporter, SP family, general alpha glucoside:H+ symporter
MLNGYISERFGFKRTMLGALGLITTLIFIPFFAPSLEVLVVGQVLMGIPCKDLRQFIAPQGC